MRILHAYMRIFFHASGPRTDGFPDAYRAWYRATLRRSRSRLFSDSDRVLLAVGRETSGPASALRAPAGSGSGMMHIHMSHPGMHPGPRAQFGAQRQRRRQAPCSTAASSAPVAGRYRPVRRPQLRARAWDCGLSGSLCRPPAAAGATLLSRMAAGTVVVREAACIL